MITDSVSLLTTVLLLQLLNIALEVLARMIWQGKQIKVIQTEKEEVKLTILADHMTLYVENLKDSTKKLLKLSNYFSKVAGYKIHTEICCISIRLG